VILKTVYGICLQEYLAQRKCWLINVKQMLYEYGFGYVWEQQSTIENNTFIKIFKQRLIDNFYQTWFANKANSEVLNLYNIVKTNFGYESYLDILSPELRVYLSRIRLSAHSLAIQTGRFGRNRIPRAERYCVFCNTNDIEDEFHFIIKCQCYVTLRKKYIKEYFYKRPSMVKFLELLKSDDKKCLTNLANYLKCALSVRLNLSHTT